LSIEILRGFPSKAEGFTRTVRVFLPRQYEQQNDTRFGLLVMHDGQNVFEHPESARWPTWSADRALQWLLDEGRLPGPWIIVAVDHGLGRFEDFSPWPEPRANVTGHAHAYARFITDELVPWARGRFRLHEGPQFTATCGSSLGGLISLFLGWQRPDVFGRVVALSPSVMWSEDGLFRHWTAHTGKWTKIWLDAGDGERFYRDNFLMEYGQRVVDFHQHLLSLGYAHHEVRCFIEPGGMHDEATWARRLPMALEWALGS
jgi:predicted alpha/beta superfamily hydrolase